MHENDYLRVLEAVDMLDFGVGKTLLSALLIGGEHDSIERNGLKEHDAYGSLAYTDHEVNGLIEECRNHNLIEYQQVPHKPNIHVLALTDRGEKELQDPSQPIPIPDIPYTNRSKTEKEKTLIDEFDFFLDGYNDAQKRAIINPDQTILCVAAAGTGKTTVLIKRIEYLTKYAGVDPDDILAITFTRKARDEMNHRLQQQDVHGVNINTFNAYAEQLIQNNTDGSIPPLASYPDKIQLLHKSLDELGHSPETALDIYFTDNKQQSTSQNNLLNNLLRDTVRLITQNKLNNTSLDNLETATSQQDFLKRLSLAYQGALDENKRRLHADQLTDATTILSERPDEYEHVLIDEYQDVNDAQIQIIDRIDHDNLFCVGDPRQSIYGWRGSRIEHTTNFTDEHPDATIITLTKNYRSTQDIISHANETIQPMLLPPVEPVRDDKGLLTTKQCARRHEEHEYVAQRLEERDHPVLVLARRNKQLDKLSSILDEHNINHTVKANADDTVTSTTILATIHAVKGLEAPTVVLIGASATNHPLRVSDHPLLDQLQPETYNRDAEERRLFYVALTRAEDELIVTWTGTKTTYLSTTASNNETTTNAKTVEDQLTSWRKQQSEAARIPEFKILPNSTLRKILKEQPKTKDDLHDIWGFTPKRIEKYGDDILEIMRT